MDGRKLAMLRRDAGLSRVHLARKAQLDPTAISELERGIQTNPKFDTLLALARALRCRVVDFAPELGAIPDESEEVAG